MMNEFILIPHKEVTYRQLEQIIEVKSQAWPYSFDSQRHWIEANLKVGDVHAVLASNEKILAYLNLIEIEIRINDVVKNAYGIGNVCAREPGKGWGSEIIRRTNLYIKQINKIGLLFCKDSLTRFYKLNSWKLIEKDKVKLSFNNEKVETMIFNNKEDLSSVQYLGKPF